MQSLCNFIPMPNFSFEQMESYIATARKRQQQQAEVLRLRQERGMAIAHQAAKLLKHEFGAAKVVLFGSLLTEYFGETSDIDLAVWGMPEKQYFQAVSRLLSLSEFSIDLVEIQHAHSHILEAIAQGQEL
jgi:predicted nucleotidyltransferase